MKVSVFVDGHIVDLSWKTFYQPIFFEHRAIKKTQLLLLTSEGKLLRWNDNAEGKRSPSSDSMDKDCAIYFEHLWIACNG